MMDAREYLGYFREAEARIQLKVKQVKELQEQLTSISAPMDKEVVSHTPNVAIMADTVALIVDMQREIDQQTNVILMRKREAYALLDRIKADSADLLIKHYFNGISVRELGRTIHVEKRQAQRKLNNAISEFQVVLDQKDVSA